MSKVKAKKWVVHCKKEAYDVYIGRGSRWGNPFTHKQGTKAKWIVGSVEEAIQKYVEWLSDQEDLLIDIHELRGKVLGCWCKFKGNELCHGDVLAELANNSDEE